MIGVVGIRRVGWWLLLFVLAGVMAGCGSDGEVATPSLAPSTTAIADVVLEVDEFGILDTSVIIDSFYPEISEDDVEVVNGDAGRSYRYVFPTGELSDGVLFGLEARWDPVDGGLQPSLEWNLTGGESSSSVFVFVASLPKSFAETVDDIVFDPQPDEVVDPDPVVAWEMSFPLQSGLLSAVSNFIVKSGDPTAFLQVVLADLNYIRVHRELTVCAKWDSDLDMMLKCHLNVVAQNPEHFGATSCAGLGRMINLGDDYPAFSHACRTVIELATTGATDGCDRAPGQVSRSKSEREICLDLVWELLAGACPFGDALERQICLYEAAVTSNHEQKCDYLARLGSPEMANDCRAAVTKDPSYCAITEDPDLRASCCENFRGTDAYDTCFEAIGGSVTEESTSPTTDDETTTSDAEEPTTTEPAEEGSSPAIPAGTYGGSFNQELLIYYLGYDSGIPTTNTITITIDDEGLISGGFAVRQEGSFYGCPGAVDDYVFDIDAGQSIGSELPQIVTLVGTYSGRESVDDELACLDSPTAFSDHGSLRIELTRISDGVLIGTLLDPVQVPFKLRPTP